MIELPEGPPEVKIYDCQPAEGWKEEIVEKNS
jgi:hypothetical protein